MINIAQAFIKTAKQYPHGRALVTKGLFSWRVWSFSELLELSTRRFWALKRGGISPGDRVVLMVRPSAEFIALTFALFALGAVVILIDPGMGPRNLLRCIAKVEPVGFVGIMRAQILRLLFRHPFKTVKRSFQAGPFPLLGRSLKGAAPRPMEVAAPADGENLAAILYTTGSTGPPKGVEYSHAIFLAQLKTIREFYAIGPGEIDQPAFPLFALFTAALGATAVIPRMDPSRPAKVDPQKFVASIRRFGVTYSFGSPAIWEVVSRYCAARNETMPTLKKVLMAGAPVGGDLIARTKRAMATSGEVYIPYGATEALPIVNMCGEEVCGETWSLSEKGRGMCVGRPIGGVELRIMAPVDGPLSLLDKSNLLGCGEIGEIIVRGEVVTRAYANDPHETEMAKIADPDGSFWHRMGDMGYLDDQGRLWFCGRKAHRVITPREVLYSVCVEAIFNAHPQVRRSALVGVKIKGVMTPVVVLELVDRSANEDDLFCELRSLGGQRPHTSGIKHFLVKDEFPVDIRHNAKIFREKLAVWAGERLGDRDE